MTKVALLGTGLMGSAMAEAMLRRGDEVVGWNRTRDRARPLERLGARVAPLALLPAVAARMDEVISAGHGAAAAVSRTAAARKQ